MSEDADAQPDRAACSKHDPRIHSPDASKHGHRDIQRVELAAGKFCRRIWRFDTGFRRWEQRRRAGDYSSDQIQE